MAKARAITGLDLQAPTARNARIIVRERLADMYTYTKYIDDPEHTQQLHDLRIAAKRVRYTLEIFADYLPEESQGFAEELATLQDELGELHDSEVMLALLRLSLGEALPQRPAHEKTKVLLPSDLVEDVLEPSVTPGETVRQGMALFLKRQELRREQCYTTFRQHWERLEQDHFQQQIIRMLDRKEDHKQH